MTATPILFRRAIESLYEGRLCPFLETAVESLEAIFEVAGARPPAQGVDISNHTVARPSRDDMVCILNRHYPRNKENLETWTDDKLFAAYRHGISIGVIPYDLSKGYLGRDCPEPKPVPPPQPAQSNYNPPPQKSAERLSTTVTNFVKNSPKYKNP